MAEMMIIPVVDYCFQSASVVDETRQSSVDESLDMYSHRECDIYYMREGWNSYFNFDPR